MGNQSVTPVETRNLQVVANPHDLRRDLHTFVQYVNGRSIKRSYRGNELPKADVKRLSQLLHIDTPEPADNYYRYGAEARDWLDYIDQLSLRMGFVHYDSTGVYRGFTSSEPSFPDNYIGFQAESYRQFILLPLTEQEQRLRDTLIDDTGRHKDRFTNYGHNEFFEQSVLGRLDRFEGFGIAVGVLPTLNFGAIRRVLFDVLGKLEVGKWFSTASLIAHMKANHPYFLIPETPKVARGGRFEWRYANFYEERFQRDKPIPDNARDGFERVEGRYIERFLEGIPLTLGYVEVAYDPDAPKASPSRGELAAFRLTERFRQVQQNDIPEPRVIVQPNFEIYIESPFYPAYLIQRLSFLADIVKEDATTILLKLVKQKVAAEAAENDGFDVVETLQTLTGATLPQNVVVELQEWAGHADVFTLYNGFGLIEGDATLPELKPTELIGESLRLIRDPQSVYQSLRADGEVVLYVRHGENKFQRLPEQAQTLFPRKLPQKLKKEKLPKQAVTVKRETQIALYFPSDELFEKFRKGLLDSKCLIVADKSHHAITLSGRYEAEIKAVIKSLGSEYAIRVEDIE